MKDFSICRLNASTSDNDVGRIDIDLTDARNKGLAWDVLRDIITLRRKPISEYIPINAFAPIKNVEKYHGYGSCCWMGFYSKVVKDLILKLCPNDVDFLPVIINDVPYFTPFFNQSVAALDLEKSRVWTFPGDATRYLGIHEWTLRRDMLRDPMVFFVRESPMTFLITETVAVALAEQKLRGLEIVDVEGFDRSHPKWNRRTIDEVVAARLGQLQ